jgi:hypothetical protein
MQLSYKKQFGFHVFTHKESSIGSYKGFTTLPSRSRGQKWIQDLSKPFKIKKRAKKGKKKEKDKKGEKYQ